MNSLLNKSNPASKPNMLYAKAKPVVQAKLTVNAPGDIYEQEADAMADRVMRMSSNVVAKPVTGLIGKSLQRKCAHCEEEEERRRKPLMRKVEAGSSGMSVSSSFSSTLNATKGGGSPLPQGTRSFMENAFSSDFSGVRVHTGSQATEMSKGINAKAFTYGSDIYFNRGEYSPNTEGGKRLLAHELTHTIQQSINEASPLLQRVEFTPAQIRSLLAALERQASEPVSMSREEIAALSEERAMLMEQLAQATRRSRVSSSLSSTSTPAEITPPVTPSEPHSRPPLTEVAPQDMVDIVVTGRQYSASSSGPISSEQTAPTYRGGPAGPGYQTNAAIQVVDANREQVAFELSQYDSRRVFHAERQIIGRLRLQIFGRNLVNGRMIVAVDQLACSDCIARLRAFAQELGLSSFEVWTPSREGAGPKWAARTAAVRPANPPLTPQTGTYRTGATLAQGESFSPPSTRIESVVPPETVIPVEPAVPVESVIPVEPAVPVAVEPVVPVEPVVVPAEPVIVPVEPSVSSGEPGLAGGLLSFGLVGLTMIAGIIHTGAVRRRIRHQSATQGYVSTDAPSGEGLLYDLSAWLIDPFGSAEASVPVTDRLNIPVWRRRIRQAAAALSTGQTFIVTWDVGRCSFDVLGHQEVEHRPVIYRREANGTFVLIEGNGSGLIDINSVISTAVSDVEIRREVLRDRCSSYG